MPYGEPQQTGRLAPRTGPRRRTAPGLRPSRGVLHQAFEQPQLPSPCPRRSSSPPRGGFVRCRAATCRPRRRPPSRPAVEEDEPLVGGLLAQRRAPLVETSGHCQGRPSSFSARQPIWRGPGRRALGSPQFPFTVGPPPQPGTSTNDGDTATISKPRRSLMESHLGVGLRVLRVKLAPRPAGLAWRARRLATLTAGSEPCTEALTHCSALCACRPPARQGRTAPGPSLTARE